jgi:hypothetical protein
MIIHHLNESGWGAERVGPGNRPADLKARQTLITWVFIELTLVARTRPLDHFSPMRVPLVGPVAHLPPSVPGRRSRDRDARGGRAVPRLFVFLADGL